MATLRDLLATPYVVHIRAVRDDEGEWARRAEHPELPECFAIERSPWDAVARLEDELPAYLLRRVFAGEDLPRPRRPLKGIDVDRALDERGLGRYRRYLDEEIDTIEGAEREVSLEGDGPGGTGAAGEQETRATDRT